VGEVHGEPWTVTGIPGSVLHMTTTQEMAPTTASTMSYSEIMRREVKAACARRDMTGRDLAGLLGVSQQTVSDRWRGRTPWTLDDVERLETVLGLSRGALLIACARRDSNPQPSDLWPLQVWLAIDECPICGSVASQCTCTDAEEFDLAVVEQFYALQFEDLVAAMSAGHEGDCAYPTTCGSCLQCLACRCACWDWAEHDNVAATAAGVGGEHEECCEHEECDDAGGGCLYTDGDAGEDGEVWEQDDEDEARRGQCVICSGDCDPGQCVQFSDVVPPAPASAGVRRGDKDEELWELDDEDYDDDPDPFTSRMDAGGRAHAWELAA
jgi:plasmid maintenance system antidote protein VapI